MRRLILFSALLSLLAACQPNPIAPTPTANPCPTIVPTPTLMPYWNLQSGRGSLGQPEGGWQTVRLEDIGVSFQVPAVWDQGACYERFVTEKQVGDLEYTLIGYGGSASRISIYAIWNDDLEALALCGQVPEQIRLLSEVEPVIVGGFPGYRYASWSLADPAIAYSKVVAAKVGNRLVLLTYLHMVEMSDCQAPPFSAEAIFEHLVESIEFFP